MSLKLLLFILVPLAPVLFPSFCIHTICVLDFFLQGSGIFIAFENPLVQKYHSFLVSRLPDIPEQEPVIFDWSKRKITKEELFEASNGYTTPVVVRNIMKNVPAIQEGKWSNTTWWKENYGSENVLCKYVEQVKGAGDAPECSIASSFGNADGSDRMYISGESRLFVRNPELQKMVANSDVDSIAPGDAVFTQLFMGYPGMGSDIHGAMGTNMFRQIAGRKKWWLIPPHQTYIVNPSLNPNGFSAHTLTKIGKGNEDPSPWLSKIQRFTVTLEPGDVLLNPAWFWHGIENLPFEDGSDSLVIGVPTRYKNKYALPAFKNNWLFSLIGLTMISKNYGYSQFTSDPSNLQNGIEKARNARAQQFAAKGEADANNKVAVPTEEEIAAMEKELEEREKMERAM